MDKPYIPFRCTGVDGLGASIDGRVAMVEIVEENGRRLTISFPPEFAQVLANRFQAAADIAQSRIAAGPPAAGQYKAAPAPVATAHLVQVSDDASTLALSFGIGTSQLTVRLSASRSARLRADLEAIEKALEQRKRETRN